MFGDVYLVGKVLELVTDDAVGEAEVVLHSQFPFGYREYVTTFGDGDYNDRVHVLLPSQILADYVTQQKVWAENPQLYEDYDNVIPHARLVQMIKFAGTDDGVDVVFHPDTPSDLYLLTDDAAYHVGGSLGDALDWIFQTGIATPKVKRSVLTAAGEFVERDFRYFEPYTGRVNIGFVGQNLDIFQQARDLLVGMATADQEGMTCVSHVEEEIEGSHFEWLQLLVREYAGNIRCVAPTLQDASTSINITYDETRDTESLERLRSSLHHIGYR